MKNYIASILILCGITNTHAAFIDNGAFLTDTDTNLEWLDVTTTLGLSYTEVNAQLGGGGTFEGFRYATTDDFNTLIGNWTGNTVTPGNYGVITQAEGAIDDLVTILGNTCVTCSSNAPGFTDVFATQGLLTDSISASYRFALIYDNDNSPANADSTVADLGSAPTGAVSSIGSFLVKEQGVITPIPEPVTLGLLALGFTGIRIFRRRSIL